MAARETVTTRFMTTVGAAGTKYRIKVRQREGAPVLDTLANLCTFRAVLHARSNLLAADTTISASNDSFLDKVNDDFNRSTLEILTLLNYNAATGAEPIFEFDVSALTGLTWKSVKLRLTYDGGDSAASTAALRYLTKDVDIATCTWNHYDKTNSPLAWATPGARSSGDGDLAFDVAWPLTSDAPGTTILSPDLTAMVQEAQQANAGTLFMLMFWTAGASQWHSLEATVAASLMPTLVFEAF